MKIKKKEFSEYVKSRLLKSMHQWEQYKQIRNKVANAMRAAKKVAMKHILSDTGKMQWEKIKLLKGSDTCRNMKTDVITIDGQQERGDKYR